jgi:hypothetical protein
MFKDMKQYSTKELARDNNSKISPEEELWMEVLKTTIKDIGKPAKKLIKRKRMSNIEMIEMQKSIKFASLDNKFFKIICRELDVDPKRYIEECKKIIESPEVQNAIKKHQEYLEGLRQTRILRLKTRV